MDRITQIISQQRCQAKDPVIFILELELQHPPRTHDARQQKIWNNTEVSLKQQIEQPLLHSLAFITSSIATHCQIPHAAGCPKSQLDPYLRNCESHSQAGLAICSWMPFRGGDST